MKSTVLWIVWAWLIFNVVLTLGSFFIRSRKARRLKNSDALSEDYVNLKLALLNAFRELFEKILGFSILAFFISVTPSFFSVNFQWSLLSFFACLVLADFLYFFAHYIEHKVQFFWNLHSVHHSSTSFSLTTGYRLCWIAFVFDWLFYWPLGLLGFPLEMILVCITLITCYAHILHTRFFPSIPWLEYIINTPKAHRIHHSSYQTHLDKNMAGIFMLWDHLFGTFCLKKDSKVVFGLTEPLDKNDMLTVNFSEWQKSFKLFSKMNLKEKLLFLLRSPEKNKKILG